MHTLTPSQCQQWLHQLITNGIARKRSICLWSAPGTGKSSIVHAVSKANQRSVIDLRLAQIPVTDLRGLPVPVGDTVTYLRPHFLPINPKGSYTLFLDEFNQCTPMQQAVARQLILDRRVGDHILPPDTIIIAACNRVHDRSAAFEMSSADANRFLHVTLISDVEAFTQYAIETETIPEEIVAFLNFRPELLHAYENGSIAFPTPRSWEFAADLHTHGMSIAPAVGEPVAVEFAAFLQYRDNIKELASVLQGNMKVPFPEENSARYGAVFFLIYHATTAEAIVNAFSWLGRIGAEWNRLFLSNVEQRVKQMKLQPQLIAAMQANPELMQFAQSVLRARLYAQSKEQPSHDSNG